MLARTLLCLCAAVCASSAQEAHSRVVQIEQGPVHGYWDPRNGIFSFRSIPYATAPTGRDRFKAPLPAPAWMTPFEAVDKRIVCPQAPFPPLPPNRNMQEDCLIASVYVPDTKENNLPVVVYVHGGAFQVGFGDWMVPKELVKENNVIAVTFNYRLGAHGFLSLGTENVPGNAGMKDQVELLRWVKKNIHSFGGNPDDVTIAGYSAGSSSVDLLMLSKSAEGLFNKVICESGANIAAFTIQSNPLENAKWYARTLNFTNVDDIHALEKFYTSIPFNLLHSDTFFDKLDSTFVFSPCLEQVDLNKVFLDKSPVDILRSGDYKKVPVLYGFANMEGILRLNLFDLWKEKMNERFADFLPPDLKFDSQKHKNEVANIVKEFYFGDKPVSVDNILSYIDFFTDVLFSYPMLRSVKLHREAGHDQIYLYEYSFVDDNSPLVPYTNVRGATHCAQTSAVFFDIMGLSEEIKDKNTMFSEDFKIMSKILREVWSTFMKTGKPEASSFPPWPAVDKVWSPYMSLSNEFKLQQSPLLERRVRFWEDLYSKYYRDPVAASEYPRHVEL